MAKRKAPSMSIKEDSSNRQSLCLVTLYRLRFFLPLYRKEESRLRKLPKENERVNGKACGSDSQHTEVLKVENTEYMSYLTFCYIFSHYLTYSNEKGVSEFLQIFPSLI